MTENSQKNAFVCLASGESPHKQLTAVDLITGINILLRIFNGIIPGEFQWFKFSAKSTSK